MSKSPAALAVALTLFAPACAAAPSPQTETYPAVALTYRDLSLASDGGPARLVARIDQTAVDHCARYGVLLTPAHRRAEPRYCINGVRAEIVRALPPEVRAIYEAGRRRP